MVNTLRYGRGDWKIRITAASEEGVAVLWFLPSTESLGRGRKIEMMPRLMGMVEKEMRR